MKVKFPILIKGVHQFNKLMDYLDKYGILWKTGCHVEHYVDFCRDHSIDFPVYILFNTAASAYPHHGYLTFYNQNDLFCEKDNPEEYLASKETEVEFEG